jgi:hypothetical protein
MSLTVVETAYFITTADEIWSDDERADIVATMPQVYEAGVVIKGSGGVRKIRAPIAGTGKSGGARIVYFVKHTNGEIWLIAAYKKSVADKLPTSLLKKLKEELE